MKKSFQGSNTLYEYMHGRMMAVYRAARVKMKEKSFY